MCVDRKVDIHDWDKLLDEATLAYNNAVNKSSGFSPFEMMFSNQPTLPIDRVTGIPLISEDGHSDLIRMNGDLNRAEASKKYRAKQLPNTTKLTIGDQVLLKRTFGKHPKMSVKWKTDSQDKPYVVIKKVGPVNYAIESSIGGSEGISPEYAESGWQTSRSGLFD